jgi:hypothetical protein
MSGRSSQGGHSGGGELHCLAADCRPANLDRTQRSSRRVRGSGAGRQKSTLLGGKLTTQAWLLLFRNRSDTGGEIRKALKHFQRYASQLRTLRVFC